jgi:membrane-associated phospholipid phosphatase
MFKKKPMHIIMKGQINTKPFKMTNINLIDNLDNWISKQHKEQLRVFGDYAKTLIPVGAACFQLALGNKAKVTYFIGAAILNKLLIYTWNQLFPKKRPDYDLQSNPRLNSFPSGHTVDAFLGVGLSLGAKAHCFALILLGPAILVGISRIINKRHYPFDVIFGASQGLLLGYLAGMQPSS